MPRTKLVTVGGQEYTVVVKPDGSVLVNGAMRRMDLQPVGDTGSYSAIMDDECYDVFVREVDGDYWVDLGDTSYQVTVRGAGEPVRRTEAGTAPSVDATTQIRAPMPGVVADVFAREGQRVTGGDVLVVLESMKMLNEMRSPGDGVVQSVLVTVGERVERQQVLVTVGPEP